MRRADPRQSSFGGRGYGAEGWEEDDEYPASEYERDERGPRQRRGGLFGFLRRR
ncbi:MAG TPA: hypothetical protein VF120_11640 [Ktedonobacterales bacterium]